MKRTDITVTLGAEASDVDYILANLRPADLYEFACADLCPNRDRDVLVKLATSPEAMVFRLRGEPVFVWGIHRHAHVGILWGYGTSKTPRIIPAATRLGKRWWLKRAFDKEGIRRIEVRVPLNSQHSISWLRKLGMTVECWDIRDHSSNGATMVQLAYTTKEYIRDYVHIQATGSSGPGIDSGPAEDVV